MNNENFGILQVADFGMSLDLNFSKSHISGIRHGTPLYGRIQDS